MVKFTEYDFETHSTKRTRPYTLTFYQLSKIAGRYNRDLTHEEINKCRKDTLVFDGDECVKNASDFKIKFKGGERNTFRNKIVEYNLQLHAHNGSGYDTWVMLKNLPCDKHIVDIVKNGKSTISLRVFNGYIHNSKKQSPQNLIFRCGMTHVIYLFKKTGKIFKIQKELLKTKINHDEIFADNSRD